MKVLELNLNHNLPGHCTRNITGLIPRTAISTIHLEGPVQKQWWVKIIVNVNMSHLEYATNFICGAFLILFSIIIWSQSSKTLFTIRNKSPIHNTCGYIAKFICNTNTAPFGRWLSGDVCLGRGLNSPCDRNSFLSHLFSKII